MTPRKKEYHIVRGRLIWPKENTIRNRSQGFLIFSFRMLTYYSKKVEDNQFRSLLCRICVLHPFLEGTELLSTLFQCDISVYQCLLKLKRKVLQVYQWNKRLEYKDILWYDRLFTVTYKTIMDVFFSLPLVKIRSSRSFISRVWTTDLLPGIRLNRVW